VSREEENKKRSIRNAGRQEKRKRK